MIDWHCVLDRETHELVTEPFDSLKDLQAWVEDASAVEDTDRWIMVRLVEYTGSFERDLRLVELLLPYVHLDSLADRALQILCGPQYPVMRALAEHRTEEPS
jgi:hypothetical protein